MRPYHSGTRGYRHTISAMCGKARLGYFYVPSRMVKCQAAPC